MMKVLLISFLSLAAAPILANDNPLLSAESLSYGSDFENLGEGSSEVVFGLSQALGDVAPVVSEASLAYRYFFADDIAVGGLFKYKSLPGLERYTFGLSGRWYFLKAGLWAFHLTQNLVLERTRVELLGSFVMQSDNYRGETMVGADYFINENLSIGGAAGVAYNVDGKSEINPVLKAMLSIGFHF